ncbi:TrlF family AAA-like ATPase [Flavobacterium sp.]|uniref:TrlF family AAA-like ATPase n=1 Tax=Flavobacterium sp. TaxID=239 RepID=UPI003D0C9747
MSNRGSEWRIWDLHIHTPYSINQHYNNSPEGWEKFINALENLPLDVKVIGITDYYFIDGYKKVMEFRKNGRLQNIDKIFPILEFRIDTFGTASENDLQKVNLHILFDVNENELGKEIEKIKNEFIEIIPITKLHQHLTKMLTKENLTIEGGDNLQNGFSNLIPSTDKVFELLNSSVWKDKTFLFLGYKEWSNLEKNQQLKPFKEKLYNDVMAFFSNSFDTNEKNQNWLNQFGNKKLLHSLDIHGFDLLDTYEFDGELKKQCEKYKCFTWIKADPTFQGLKQIIYEPEERIKIQKEKPDFKEDKVVIDEVKFISSDNNFNTNSIKFNPNLNVIIGGKSSGKSILLYNIARTLSTDEKLFTDEKIENKYNFREGDNADISFNFLVETKVGISQLRFDDPNKNIMPDIKYIPQNYLIKLAEPEQYKTGDSLNKVIRNLIVEDPISKLKYNDVFEVNVKANDKERERIIENYFEIKSKIVDLEVSLKSKSNKEVLEKNIQSNLDKINELKKSVGLSEADILKYNLVQKDLEIIISDGEKITNDFKKVLRFNKETENSLNELNRQKDILSLSLENIEIKTLFDETFQDLDNLSKKLSEFIASYENQLLDDGEFNFFKENKFKTLLTDISNRKKVKETELDPYRKNEIIEKNIKELESSIEVDRKNLNLIIQINKEIITFKEEMKSEKRKLFNLYKKNVKEYLGIVEGLKERVKVLEKEGLIIKGLIKFNFPKFRKNLLDISHGGSKTYKNWNIFNEDLNALDSYGIKSFIKDIHEIFISIEEGKYSLLSRIDKIHAVKTLLDDYFFDYWEIEYKGDKLGKMSTGKASFVILMMIVGLSESKSPILIDQPEDNLDNRSVSKELVEYLKVKKKERQIILVTHNPNIVVNADAENVIIANQNGQNETGGESTYQFDYINGSLENSFSKIKDEEDVLKSMGIREHIADIVEGGKEAFKKREEKYGF